MCNRRKNSDLSAHYQTKEMMLTQWKNVGISSKKMMCVHCGNTTLLKSILPTSSARWRKSSWRTRRSVGSDKTWTQSFFEASVCMKPCLKTEALQANATSSADTSVWRSSLLHHRHSAFISRSCSKSSFLHSLLPIVTFGIAIKCAFESWNFSLSRQKFGFCKFESETG